jgi:hypothetical protein
MVTAKSRKVVTAMLMLAIAAASRLVQASYNCGYIGGDYVCEWAAEPHDCSYFEYECENMCEDELNVFSCDYGPESGAYGRCSCES